MTYKTLRWLKAKYVWPIQKTVDSVDKVKENTCGGVILN